MYGNFFGLSSLPFEERADTRFYFGSTSSEEALAFMEYEAKYGRALASVIGAAGTGKTLLLRTLLMRFDTKDKVVVITWPHENQANATREVCKSFGVTLPSNYTRSRGLARLRRHLRRFAKNGQRAVLLIDQAENMSPDDLAHIEAMSELQENGQTLLAVLLVGQPQFRDTLMSPDLLSLQQRLSGERVLAPMTNDETHAYIAHRLKVAGAADPSLFQTEAVDLIHEASHGIPRLINSMANEAVLAAYGKSQKIVTLEMAQEVVKPWLDLETTNAPVAGKISSDASMPRANVLASSESSTLSIGPDKNTPATLDDSLPWDSMPDGDDASTFSTGSNGGGTTTAGATSVAPDMRVTLDRKVDEQLSTAPAVVGANAMLDMLQRATAHAERVGATNEAGLLQAKAVEKHLSILTAQAERLGAEISQSVQRNDAYAYELSGRLDEQLAKYRTQISALENELLTVTDQTKVADARIKEIQQIAHGAEQVEASLKTTAEGLADQADVVQARISAAMMETEALAAANDRAEIILTRVDDSNVRLEANVAQVEQRMAEQQRASDQLTAESEARRQQIDQFSESLLVDARQQLEKSIDGALTSFEHRLAEKMAASEKSMRRLEERYVEIEKLSEKMHGGLVERERRLELMVQRLEDAGAQTADLDTRLRTIMETHDDRVARGQKLLGDVEAGFVQAERLQRGLSNQLADIGRAHDEASDIRSQILACKPVIADMANYLSESEEKYGKLEDVLTRAEIVHTDWSHQMAAGQVRAEELQAQLANASEELQATAIDIRTRLRAEADSAVDDMRGAAREAEAQVDREIGRCLEDAREQSGALIRTTKSELEATRDVMKQTIDETRSACEESTHRLKFESEEAQTRYRSMHEQVSSAMGSLAQEAEAKIGKLNSHQAAASQVITRLSTTTQEGHQLLTQSSKTLSDIESRVEETTQRVDGQLDATEKRLNETLATADRVERMIGDVWALSEHVEVATTSLRAGYQDLKPLADEVSAITNDGEAVRVALQSESKKAEQTIQTLKRRGGQMSELIERLSAASKVMRNANTLQESLQGLLDQSGTMIETMQQQVSTGEQRLASFGEEQQRAMIASAETAKSDINDALDKASETEVVIRELMGQAMELTSRYDGALDTSQQVLGQMEQVFTEAGATREEIGDLLAAFETQIASVGQSIGQLESRAIELERTVADATKQPATLIEAAQEQAAQLERVCTAVKKVFASLSQRALEAKAEADACRDASHKATTHAKAMKSVSDQLRDNLQAWIEEATTVQTRLERTIQRAPSISQTHSSAVLESLTGGFEHDVQDRMKMLRSPEAVTTARAATTPVDTAQPVGTSEHLSPGTTPTTKPNGKTGNSQRAEEISALLNEAKRRA
ncbi:MAG: AAA family ATPase [Phycisphaerae bacterium]